MSFPRYERYKGSGVEWLGEVPAGWEVVGIKRLCSLITDGAHISPETDNGVYGFVSTKDINADTIDFDNCLRTSEASFEYLVKAGCRPLVGDVLFSKDGTIGRTVVVRKDLDFVVASSLIIIRPDSSVLAPEFLNYLCMSDVVASQVDSLVKGAGLPRLSIQNLLKVLGVFPPLPEQQTITAFLDRETGKIDALVAEQQRLIELLKEKRQAVISHAVTKGLNPAAPMKDSGVEWLGEVPAGWEVKKLKHIKAESPNSFVDGPFGNNLKSEHFIDNGDAYVIESNFATQGRLEPCELKTISAEHFATIRRSETKKGDIVIAKIGAQFGKSSILPPIDKPAVVSGNSMKLTVNNNICETVWAYWQLFNQKLNGEIDLLVNGSAQPALSLGTMNELAFLLPNIDEQKKIIAFLDTETVKFDTLVSEAERAVSLLKERRTALISAAVTGKIDVRNGVGEVAV
jgi:type I restriction enzyme, S subunit